MKSCNILKDSGVNLELHNDEIHIWFASLEQSESQFQALSQTLSKDEHIRAERFLFDKDRKRLVICRGILRKILGNYLGVDPDKLMFCYGKYGKPALVDTFNNGKICFNLAHSEGFAIYAFTIGHEIGVDIEYIRDIPEMTQIAEYLFSVAEKETFHALPESKKQEVFFNCWTRKEAIIKATGDGLSRPLNKFDVTFSSNEPTRVIRTEGYLQEASQWYVHDMEPLPGYTAAVAVKGINSWQIRYYQWSSG